jgi:non-ribosomal peptide synthetase component E (peptide arylation enzyme)
MAILPLGHNYNLASPGHPGRFYTGGTVVLAPARTRPRSSAWSNRSA